MWRRVRYVLLLLGLTAIATCPAAWRDFRRKNRADEARALLAYMADRVKAEHASRDGRLPQQSVGPTPPLGRCCEQGGACTVDKTWWQDPAWRVLGFSVDDPHRYSYQYEVVDGGRAAILRATGDLDCDGVYGVVELRLDAGPDGLIKQSWRSEQPLE